VRKQSVAFELKRLVHGITLDWWNNRCEMMGDEVKSEVTLAKFDLTSRIGLFPLTGRLLCSVRFTTLTEMFMNREIQFTNLDNCFKHIS